MAGCVPDVLRSSQVSSNWPSTCIWIHTCQSFVSSPPKALTGERGWGAEQEGDRMEEEANKEDEIEEEEESDKWRIVEVPRL